MYTTKFKIESRRPPIIKLLCLFIIYLVNIQEIKADQWIRIEHAKTLCDSLGNKIIQISAKKNSAQICEFNVFNEYGVLVFSHITPLVITPQSSTQNAQYILDATSLQTGTKYCIVGNCLSIATDTFCFKATFNNCTPILYQNCNYIQNGDFEIGTNIPGTDEDIHKAKGWSGIWLENSSSSTGDLDYSVSTGNYGAFWVANSSKISYREGIMNNLTQEISVSSKDYILSFKMRKKHNTWGNPILNVYGIKTNSLGIWPSSNLVLNTAIFPGNSSLVLIGSIPLASSGITGDFKVFTLPFNASILGSQGIDHIFLTRSDNSGGGMYVEIDSVRICQIKKKSEECCVNNLRIWGNIPIPPSSVSGPYTHSWESVFVQAPSNINISEIICNIERVDYLNANGMPTIPINIRPLSNASLFGELVIPGMIQYTLPYSIGYSSSTNFHQIVWRSNDVMNGTPFNLGDELKFHYLLPRKKGSLQKARVCMRITIRDIECNVCEIYTCSEVLLK